MGFTASFLDFGIDPRLIYGAMWLIVMVAISAVLLFGFDSE